jgi:hypothetical protein
LICPQLVATARSAIVVSSVSPDRWLIIAAIAVRSARGATASRVSVRVPIWFTFTSMALATDSSMPRCSRAGFVTEQVVADQLDAVPDRIGDVAISSPVVLGERILDRGQREVGEQGLVVPAVIHSAERAAPSNW